MHINSKSTGGQSPVPAWLFDLVPQGRDVHEMLNAALPMPSGGRVSSIMFDLTAPVLSRLSRAQADCTARTAEVTRLTFDSSGFHIKVTCPFCGAAHHHGGGAHVVPSFGHRVADCGGGSYFLLVGGRP